MNQCVAVIDMKKNNIMLCKIKSTLCRKRLKNARIQVIIKVSRKFFKNLP